MRIEPTSDAVGRVVEVIDLGLLPGWDGEKFHGPYNYSDMSGFVTLEHAFAF